jgi:hypothetical protein
VKAYLGYLLETSTEGLTAEEMGDEMRRLSVNADLAGKVVGVLSTCETARYGPNGHALIGDAARGVADDIREIFQTGLRA